MALCSSTSLLTRFQLSLPQGYSHDNLERVAKLRQRTLRKAAVLVGITERPEGATVIFTKRAAHLSHHPGQISFPGGKYEHADQSLYQTAVREAQEEIGLAATDIKVFGRLPDIITTSGFCVTPVMATIAPDYQIAVNHSEVAELFEVPAAYLFNQQNLRAYPARIRGHQRTIFAVTYQHHFIWGMTGQIIAALQRQFALPTVSNGNA